jgi:hypothetical protein
MRKHTSSSSRSDVCLCVQFSSSSATTATCDATILGISPVTSVCLCCIFSNTALVFSHLFEETSVLLILFLVLSLFS